MTQEWTNAIQYQILRMSLQIDNVIRFVCEITNYLSIRKVTIYNEKPCYQECYFMYIYLNFSIIQYCIMYMNCIRCLTCKPCNAPNLRPDVSHFSKYILQSCGGPQKEKQHKETLWSHCGVTFQLLMTESVEPRKKAKCNPGKKLTGTQENS